MADGITECSYATIEQRKECQYYGKVSYKDSEDCTHRRADGSCFIGGIEDGYEKTEGEKTVEVRMDYPPLLDIRNAFHNWARDKSPSDLDLYNALMHCWIEAFEAGFCYCKEVSQQVDSSDKKPSCVYEDESGCLRCSITKNPIGTDTVSCK